MPTARQADRLLLAALLTGAALVSLIVVLYAPPQRQGGLPRQRSTFFNTGDGTKAAYLSLERLGYTVDRLRRPIDEDLPFGVRGMAVLEPIVPLTDHEAHRLLAWVRGGGRLLLAPGGRPGHYSPPDKSTTILSDWFAWNVVPANSPALDTNDDNAELAPADRGAALDLLYGIDKLTIGSDARFSENVVADDGPLGDSLVTPLLSDDTGVIAAVLTCAAGEIIALADTHALSNRGLRQADNAIWLANLARRILGDRGPATLMFDEYHAGFPHQDPSWFAIARLMLAQGWGMSVGQAVLVAFLWLGARSVRFGRARGIEPVRRRRRGEFAVAAGRLLLAAKATDLAAETLQQHYRNRLCRAIGLPIDTSAANLRAALTARGCAWRLDALAAGEARQIRAGELLAACQHLERDLEQLEYVK